METRIAKGNTELLILCSAAINLILISLPLPTMEISMSGQVNSTLYGQSCLRAEPSGRCGGCRLLPLYSSNWPILAQGTSPLVCFNSPSFCTSFTATKDKNLTDLYKIVQTSRNIYCPFQHLLPDWWVKLFWGHLERSRPEQKSWIVDYLHRVNHVLIVKNMIMLVRLPESPCSQ